MEPPFDGLKRYVALPGTPPFVDAAGRTVPRDKILFHELILRKKDRKGRSHFLLDGKTPVRSAGRNLFGRAALRPLVETAKVRSLRHRLIGRPLWVYGQFDAWVEPRIPMQVENAQVDLEATSQVQVERIFQLDRVPLDIGRDNYLPGYESGQHGSESPFVVVYKGSFSNLQGQTNEKITAQETKRVENPANYGPPYQIYIGSWEFENALSTSKPPAGASMLVRMADWTSDVPLRGCTHEEVAWVCDWPNIRARTRDRLSTMTDWEYPGNWGFVFSGGRVVDYWRGMPY